MHFISTFLTIVVVIVSILYFQHYCPTDTLVFRKDFNSNLLTEHVKALQIVKIPIWFKNITPLTNTVSHWMIIAHLECGKKVEISSSAYQNIFISTAKDYKRILKSKLYNIDSKYTLQDIIDEACKHTFNMHYGYTLYNCQDIVFRTVSKFIPKNELKSPLKGIKFVKQIYSELF